MTKAQFVGGNSKTLAAKIDFPKGEIKAYALFAHCFTCSKDALAVSRISKILTNKQIAVLRFDFTGLGDSEGEFANTNFSSNVRDILAAVDFMRKEYEAPALLLGHSLGGSSILAAANKIPEAKAVVTIGSPADIAHVGHHFEDYREEILEEGELEVPLAGRNFTITKQFIEDIESTNIEDCVHDLKKALLILHAPLDDVVGIENAGKLFSWAKHPKSYISLDDANHFLLDRSNCEYAGYMIASWAAKYIF